MSHEGGSQRTIFYAPISLVPFKLGRGGGVGLGVIENVPMSPSGQFFFLKASLMVLTDHGEFGDSKIASTT